MDPIKRVREVMLFLIAAALLASTPVSAAAPREPNLFAVGDETGASGRYEVYVDRGGPKTIYGYPVYLSASCQGLTPGGAYRVDHDGYYAWLQWGEEGGIWGWHFHEMWTYNTLFQTTANKKGAFKGEGKLWYTYGTSESFFGDPNKQILCSEESVLVYRVEPGGDLLVLSSDP